MKMPSISLPQMRLPSKAFLKRTHSMMKPHYLNTALLAGGVIGSAKSARDIHRNGLNAGNGAMGALSAGAMYYGGRKLGLSRLLNTAGHRNIAQSLATQSRNYTAAGHLGAGRAFQSAFGAASKVARWR